MNTQLSENALTCEGPKNLSETIQHNAKPIFRSKISGLCNTISSKKCRYCQPGPQNVATVSQI